MCHSGYLGIGRAGGGWGGRMGGGSPKGLVHPLLMPFFTLATSKIEVSELSLLVR